MCYIKIKKCSKRVINMNIYDIAKEAQTSISTVSRVINNKANVNPEVKKRVEEVLKKYNYKPSAIARGMVSKTMKSIAVLTVDVRVPHYARIVYVIEQEFSKKGYNVTVCNIGNSAEECARYVKILTEKQVDGIVLIGSVFSKIIDTEENIALLKNTPVVMANGSLPYDNFKSVMVDDLGTIRGITDYLFNKGYKNIYYVHDMDTPSADIKAKGFRESLKLNNVISVESRIIETVYGLEGGKAAADKIIATGKDFDAVVFGEDITAIGAMKQFKKRGFRVPEDVAITGCNNCRETRICEPELTTIDNKPELQGQLCASILTDILDGKKVEDGVVVRPDIVERNSVKK